MSGIFVGLKSTSQEDGLLPVSKEDVFPELTALPHTTSTPKSNRSVDTMTISEERDVKPDISMLLLSREESQQLEKAETTLQEPPPEMDADIKPSVDETEGTSSFSLQ
ncbi:MAG: hypothetical protein GY800_05955 [Planctomycetes bacterium]|nr:hypothetical protein [Planctomycetota bacterium]